VHKVREASLKLLLRKLDPLLQTLSAGELTDIPVADALARRPRGARAVFHPRPPQPVEVVFARDGREIVGALLLRRKWMERTFDESHDDEVPDSAKASQKMSALCDWLNEFGELLSSWLSREMALVDARRCMQEPSDCLDMLEHYSETRPNELDALWSLPLTQYWLAFLKSGSPQTRQRLRALEERRMTDSRGRPEKGDEDLQMVVIAGKVDAAELSLAEPFRVYQALRKAAEPGSYASSREVIERELRKKDYSEDIVSAVVDSKTLPGAAQRFVASHSNGRYTVASVRAMASAGKKKLRRQQ
jgi:hypothetical protein